LTKQQEATLAMLNHLVKVFTKCGNILIIMLGGGDKNSQRTDIAVAKQRAALLED